MTVTLFAATTVLVNAMTIGTAPVAPQSPDSVDAIVARYVEARGGADALARIISLTFVSYPDQNVRGRVRVMIKMRPNYFLVGCLEPTCGFAEGVDADGAWDAHPRVGRARRIDGEAALALFRAGEFDDPIIGWRQKGHSVRLLGTDTVRGSVVDVLSVRLAISPVETIYYIDRRTGVLAGHRRAVPIHARGEHIDQLTWYEDWRPVAGVLYPHRATTYDMRPGKEMAVLEGGRGWDAIIANFSYTPGSFSPSGFVPTPVVAYTLAMYEAAPRLTREEFVAMWHTFKARSGKDAGDLGESLNWLGYELLKRNDFTRALAAFELLVAEFPTSASGWDSLGDGHEQAGDIKRAIAAYEKALSIDPKATGTRRKLQTLKGG